MKTIVRSTFTTAMLLITSVNLYSQIPFADNFNGSTLNSGWITVIPNPDCTIGLTGSGELLVNASPLNGGSDLYSGSNYNAPRIIQQVDSIGHWMVETKMRFDPNYNYQGAGIIGITDLDYTILNEEIRTIERAFNVQQSPNQQMEIGTCGNNGYLDTVVYMRLIYDSTLISVTYSADSINWSTPCSWNQKLYYVGLYAIRQPWDGNTAVYSSAYFDYFHASPVTAIAENHSSPLFTAFPNPSGNFISIKCAEEINKITVTDLTGSILFEARANANKIPLNFEQYSSGSYLIHVQTRSGNATQKVMIGH